ncbi:hypothetical protein MNEG_15187 [Monoraphidium neglectum]|uniref:RCK N-terminal domain-containing protein n=1 Tax=Monoraphidium neglectum TaxID=145388 RepID=A0A0D2LSL2_9CHLO|nr:hypothetical protein MNEG_15187 [Monoraphidium neglectum]KIY92776.1 hypothetical protein MNEG_15187 [Monoraphidium neglectum]|eukprot:XP_013891796.1 hypothetical protein MNEG_15187 [Monoraphidium neglectum]
MGGGRLEEGASMFDVALLLHASDADPGAGGGSPGGHAGGGSGGGLGRLVQSLSSASRRSHALAAALFERLYHLRPRAARAQRGPARGAPRAAAELAGSPGVAGDKELESDDERPSDDCGGGGGGGGGSPRQPPAAGIVRRSVAFEGHTLICGASTPPEALLPLLAPLRSAALPRGALAPVVVIDESSPEGPLWDQIARFEGVYFVQGSASRPETLRRANAERAAKAAVLAPWFDVGGRGGGEAGAGDEGGGGWRDALADAEVVGVVRRLKALNGPEAPAPRPRVAKRGVVAQPLARRAGPICRRAERWRSYASSSSPKASPTSAP